MQVTDTDEREIHTVGRAAFDGVVVPHGLGEAMETTLIEWSLGAGCEFRQCWWAYPDGREELLIMCRHGMNVPANQASGFIEGTSTISIKDPRSFGGYRVLGRTALREAHALTVELTRPDRTRHAQQQTTPQSLQLSM